MKLLYAILVVGLISFGCKESKNKVQIEAEINDVEWYVSSIGFSTKGGNGYYKQKVFISYSYKGKNYSSSFKAGKSFGIVKIGDKVLIEIAENGDMGKAIKRIPKKSRKKFAPVKGSRK